MAIYYFTISMLTGLGFVLTEKKKGIKMTALYLSAALIALTFFASLRYAIGFDYFSYRSIYEMTAGLAFGDILKQNWYEPLFFVVCKCLCLLNLPFQALVTVVSLFLLSAAMWFIYRYSRLPWMSVYLYITLQFLAYGMNLMRQSIAVSFFLFAYPYLKNRKAVPFAILLLVGGLFHNSLWLICPLYFLLIKKPTRRFTISLAVLAMVGYLLFDPLFSIISPILPEKYVAYQESYFWNSSSLSYALLPGIYFALIYLFRNRVADPIKRTIYLNSALYHFLASVFITKHFILERFAIYPFAFSLIAIPDIIASYRDGDVTGPGTAHRDPYYPVMLLFLLFGGAYFLFAAATGFHHVYPYVSLLDRSTSSMLH